MLGATSGSAVPERRINASVFLAHLTAADGAWLMLRGSGTEPILRIYAEATSDSGAQRLLKLGVDLTKQV